MSWLRNNIVAIVIFVGGALANTAIQLYKVDTLTVKVDGFAGEIKDVRERLLEHELDTTKHIDPNRDAERWQDLIKRLERIEKKVER